MQVPLGETKMHMSMKVKKHGLNRCHVEKAEVHGVSESSLLKGDTVEHTVTEDF